MESTLYNGYNFALEPPHNLPGFQLFSTDGDHKAYYFCCSDVHGRPFLFSQPYATNDKANTALQTTLRNAAKEKQYKRKKEENRYYFLIVSGNGQELARSSSYPASKEMEEMIVYVRQVAASKHPIARPAMKTNTPPAIDHHPFPSTSPNKHGFRLDFYKSDKHGGYQGRIEHLVSGESITFKGVSSETIGAFVFKHLPGEIASQLVKENAQLEVLNQSWVMPGALNRDEGVIKLRMQLSASSKPEKLPCTGAVELFARHLGGKQHCRISLQAVTVNENAMVLLSIPFQYLSEGIYRIHAQLTLAARGESGKESWSASCLMQWG